MQEPPAPHKNNYEGMHTYSVMHAYFLSGSSRSSLEVVVVVRVKG